MRRLDLGPGCRFDIGALAAGLRDLMADHPCIADVRGRGLLLGAEVVTGTEAMTTDHDRGARVSARCLELGLSMNIVARPGAGGVLRIAPPLTATDAELDRGLEILDEALADHGLDPLTS